MKQLEKFEELLKDEEMMGMGTHKDRIKEREEAAALQAAQEAAQRKKEKKDAAAKGE